MKRYHFLFLLALSVLFVGCAGTGDSAYSESDEAAVVGDGETVDRTGAKTAYDGRTGPGLLMERYKSGSIQGLNN